MLKIEFCKAYSFYVLKKIRNREEHKWIGKVTYLGIGNMIFSKKKRVSAWRRLQEANITNPEAFATIVDEKCIFKLLFLPYLNFFLKFYLYFSDIYSLVDDGRILRAWTRRTGTLSWQEKLEEIPQNGYFR